MKRRTLTDEEQLLWNHVTREAKPIHTSLRPAEEAKLPRTQYREQQPAFYAPPNEQYQSMPLSVGAYAGIDRNTADRFRKGECDIDGTIDLHGMSREKAHMALTAFLKTHHERGSRCLLAITGKGPRNDMQQEPSQSIFRGVLREMLPGWLTEPGLRPLVLAFDVAKPKHGGNGAYYILLRRKR